MSFATRTRDSLVAELASATNLKKVDLVAESLLYATPKTGRGVSPARLALEQKTSHIKSIIRKAAREVLKPIKVLASWKKVAADDGDLWFLTIGQLTGRLQQKMRLALSEVALRASAKADGRSVNTTKPWKELRAGADDRSQMILELDALLKKYMPGGPGLTGQQKAEILTYTTYGQVASLIQPSFVSFAGREQ